MFWRLVALACVGSWLSAANDAQADVFLLQSGGRVEGELTNPTQSPRTTYEVRTADGALLTLAANQVAEVVRPKPAELEFQRIRHTYPNTVEGQWELAQWCREQGAIDSRRVVLEHLLTLDPEHAQARSLLGYSKIEGQWKTQREAMLDRGYVEYRGRWRLPQEVALMREKDASESEQRTWALNIKMWREWLGTDRHQQAIDNFRNITDPNAIPALTQAIQSETNDTMRLALLEIVARIDVRGARELLANTAMSDASDEVRLTAIDHLARSPHRDTVNFFVQKLRDKDNSVVNRAAFVLGKIKDPSSVGPLIDALVTTHKFRIETGQSQGSTSAGFSPQMGSGFSAGGGPQVISRNLMNLEVLDALASITGRADYGYDKATWKRWLAAQRPGAENTTLRRD